MDIQLILIGFFFVLYAVLAWRRLDWGVMLLLASLPLYQVRFSLAGVPSTLLEGMILIAFAVWVARQTNFLGFVRREYTVKDYLANRKQRLRYPFDWEIAAWLIISFLAAGISGFSAEALGIWKAYFFEPVLVFVLVLNVFGKATSYKLQVTRIMWPLGVSALAVSVIAVLESFTGWFAVEHFWPRVTGPFAYPNALGLYLGPIVVILVGWVLFRIYTRYNKFPISNFQFPNIFIVLTIILSLGAIIFARSEGALIGIAAGLVLMGLLAGGRVRWATVLVVIIASAGLMSFMPFRQKIFEKATLSDLSGEIRKQQWRETWQMYRDNPEMFILGTGLAGYQEAVAPYHQPGIFFNFERDPDFRRKIVIFDEKYKAEHWQPVEVYLYPHNIFLNFWTEMGALGLLLFIWIVAKFFVVGLLSLNSQKLEIGNWKFVVLGLMGAMTVIVVHGLVDVPYFKNDLAVLFWAIIAMMGYFYLNIESSKH
jgi:O-antigen ligase